MRLSIVCRIDLKLLLDRGLPFLMCSTYRENVEITFGFDASHAYLCSMMEEDLQELSLCERSVHLTVKPFEIVTLKVYPNDKGEAQ